jgi:hypothetical protein
LPKRDAPLVEEPHQPRTHQAFDEITDPVAQASNDGIGLLVLFCIRFSKRSSAALHSSSRFSSAENRSLEKQIVPLWSVVPLKNRGK